MIKKEISTDNHPDGNIKHDPSITSNRGDDIVDFGGWESEESKLRHNLTWTPEQILTWLEEINKFHKEIRENAYVLREYY